MIYLWLIGAVVLAGADILLGTIYLLIIAAAALTAFIFALIGAGILFQLLAFPSLPLPAAFICPIGKGKTP